MSDLGIGKIGGFLLSMVGIVMVGAVWDAINSAIKVNHIVHGINLMDKLSRFPSINELPLKRPVKWSKQVNNGRNPCDSSYPDINLQKFSDNSFIASEKTGIW